jgi:hypothetical protein
MRFDNKMPKVLQLYLELSQYPILARRIRELMRNEIFTRGVVTQEVFQQEIREKAIQSQVREGISDPLIEEPPDVWRDRIAQVRDHLTDFYFAYNVPHDRFEELVQEVLSERAPDQRVILSFNPELAPWDLLFAQGEAYEHYPPEKRANVEHHLREIVVVLIKAMISDQLSFVRVAREYFTIKDLTNIRAHRFGRGKIGGKAAGMLLAYKVLQRHARQRGIDIEREIAIPESWYLGSDVYYDFHASNDLFRFMNQKYKRPDQMMADYPQSYNAYMNSRLPADIHDQLAEFMENIGKLPLIVRSSSLLEDSFDTSFAGKYDSFFLPNQGSPEKNLRELERAIIRVYASVIRPEALIYRERMGLTDYDERMAVLIQKVEGRPHERYFFPDFAGVGFSYNPYVWNERINREDGMLRLVSGLGTRAVERVGSDYPRMVALSHPDLRPEWGRRMVRRYSQREMDVIDLEGNELATLPIGEVLNLRYPPLDAVISVDRGGYVRPAAGRLFDVEPREMVVTFDNMLTRGDFVEVMRESLDVLEEAYKRPVDIEFAGEILSTHPEPLVRVSLLQCRTLSHRQEGRVVEIPTNVPDEDILFTANQHVPHGCVEDIRYIVYVDPRAYARIPQAHTRIEIGQFIGRLNHALVDQKYILMGPGRWGTSNIQLGVKVTYADIYNTSVLVEVAYSDDGSVPEVSYGTHFFQDLVEANIYPLPLYPDDPDVIFRESFFQNAPNSLSTILPADERYTPYVKVIDVPALCQGRTLTILMNGEQERAVGMLASEEEPCCDAE